VASSFSPPFATNEPIRSSVSPFAVAPSTKTFPKVRNKLDKQVQTNELSLDYLSSFRPYAFGSQGSVYDTEEQASANK
jgi:hypothetical protein